MCDVEKGPKNLQRIIHVLEGSTINVFCSFKMCVDLAAVRSLEKKEDSMDSDPGKRT